MASVNPKAVGSTHRPFAAFFNGPTTHEGAPAYSITAEQKLRRMTMACMLWEDNFYVDGEKSADILAKTIAEVNPERVAAIAIEARGPMKLRHVPLFLVRELARHPHIKQFKGLVAETVAAVIQRPDDMTELLAIFWKDGKCPIPAQIKKGLALAFTKFDSYALAKWQSNSKTVKLRDVLFLIHAKPSNDAQAQAWKQLADKELASPDTWEVALSGGADKKETFARLLTERKLGALALLRNLRNMEQAGVDEQLIVDGLKNMKTERVLPFRFISAANHASKFESELEQAMFRCLESHEKLSGKTLLLVDNSGSMYGGRVSKNSDLDASDAACALAMLVREVCDRAEIIVFGSTAGTIKPRRGFALRDEIKNSSHCGGTDTEAAKRLADRLGYDRIIIITDEQSHTALSKPKSDKAYVINVANHENGIGYGDWHHIDGWSEAVIDYIAQVEKDDHITVTRCIE